MHGRFLILLSLPISLSGCGSGGSSSSPPPVVPEVARIEPTDAKYHNGWIDATIYGKGLVANHVVVQANGSDQLRYYPDVLAAGSQVVARLSCLNLVPPRSTGDNLIHVYVDDKEVKGSPLALHMSK